MSIINPNLEALREEFEVELDHERTGKSGPIDGVNLYLYGLVLLNLQSADKYAEAALIECKQLDGCSCVYCVSCCRAREVLVSACRRYPWNWAAWEALSRSCTKYEHLLRLLDHRLVQEVRRPPSPVIITAASHLSSHISLACCRLDLASILQLHARVLSCQL